jgi:hypothetical protein
MKKLTAPLVALALALSSATAHAGGPVIIQEEGLPVVIDERPASSVGVLPVLLGVVVLCALLCGGGDDDAKQIPPEPVKDPGSF